LHIHANNMSSPNFKAGDLVKIIEHCTEETFVYRPPDFPFGKVGIVVRHSILSESSWYYPTEDLEPFFFAYDYRQFRWMWHEDELIEVLINGKMWWVFPDEIESYTK